VPLAIRTIRGAREKVFRAHRARRLTLRRRGRRFRFFPGMVSDQGCETMLTTNKSWKRTFWRTVRILAGAAAALNRTAPKKSHTAIVNWPTDGGAPVCLSAARRPLVRTHCIAHPAPPHFATPG